MQKIKIYLDNAATSFPKPRPVVDAMVEYLEHAGNPGRGAHAASLYGARRIMEARQEIAAFFGIKTEERLIFTPGCTASLNQVIKSVLGDAASGDCVITSGMEHNAVTRPIEQM
ncbi:MAG: aminotransferase class V-fold PLP-dependent enzyme, partial [Planctomycetaceae bacterium]|nr:aminotransferase class V-fold PLP-dependent enzyme [Planctomycetaceae bacterium]